jgi:hypothetical protein
MHIPFDLNLLRSVITALAFAGFIALAWRAWRSPSTAERLPFEPEESKQP